jgi:hypothetical protein
MKSSNKYVSEVAEGKRFEFGLNWRRFLTELDLAPLWWKEESFGYTLPEGGKVHEKSPKDLYTRV